MLGMSHVSVYEMARHPGFPSPCDVVACVPVWCMDEVYRFLRIREEDRDSLEAAQRRHRRALETWSRIRSQRTSGEHGE